MTELTVLLDGVRGEVKLTLAGTEGQQVLKYKWYKADDESTGFISNVSQAPIPVTEIAAELMIKLIITELTKVVDVTPDEYKIFNHLGEQLEDIEFMPPTFDGKEDEIQKFVAKQDSLKNLYLSYQEDRQLTTELIGACDQHDVLEDFLSLVQFQLMRAVFTFSNPED